MSIVHKPFRASTKSASSPWLSHEISTPVRFDINKMGGNQPFMYDAASKYSFIGSSEKSFNPRAATQASWTPSRPRPKVEGPLIQSREFNRHPDSYITAPYGNLNWKPMSPRTKDKVKWSRIAQLVLRICELIGAVGLLFCVICIKGTGGATAWIIRVPSAVAIFHTIYAIYHLSRSSKGRTPASCASYMLFASVLDVGLVPFYVLTGLMARTQFQEPAGTTGRWQTLFNNDVTTNKIILSTYLAGLVNGGLHFVSLILSIYLAVIFRQISRLPPDMNPLEDNLTSRRHKRNKSSIKENRISQATTMTANSKRGSKDVDHDSSQFRSVPFMHTRNDSHANITDIPSPNFSPRVSRTDIPATSYEQLASERSSRTNLNGQASGNSNLHRNSRTLFPNLTLQTQSPPKEDSQRPKTQEQGLHRSPTKASSVYSSESKSTIRPGSSITNSNWVAHSSPSRSPSPPPPRELKHLIGKKAPSYQPLSQTSPFEYTTNDENLPPLAPLEMNPPTPPLGLRKQRNAGTPQRVLTPGNDNARGDSGRGWGAGPGMVGIGKVRGWGETRQLVAGATRVVSRSGVEVRQGGIFPTGGVRAREVSGKVMEEGRGSGNWGLLK